MDFSVILVFPYSALLTFIIFIGARLRKRPSPRLIWPFAIATLTAAPAFVGLPTPSDLVVWVAFLIFVLPMWAAFGTIVGAMGAKLSVAVARLFREE